MAVLKLLYGTDVRTDILIDHIYRLATILYYTSLYTKNAVLIREGGDIGLEILLEPKVL